MNNSTDNRLSFKPYRRTLERVRTQFELLRFALLALRPEQQTQFFEDVSKQRIARMEFFRETAKRQKTMTDQEADEIADEQIERIKNELRREQELGNLRATSEFTGAGLNQSELLLLVAHFEAFMKLLHQHLLAAAPNKVFSVGFRDDQNPRIPVKDIFGGPQSNWDSQKFLNELIIKEVKWLDAQSIESRAEYFAERLGILFGTPEELEDLKEIMDRRNEISHEIFLSKDEVLQRTLVEGSEGPLVPDSMLKTARQLFFWIPSRCFEHGRKHFPSHFKSY